MSSSERAPLSSSEPDFWCAVQVAPRHESKVAELLSHKGYEQLAPTYKVRHIWSDRTKSLDLPLFPGYVFCKVRKETSGTVFRTYGVVRIVSFGGKLAAIPESEINALKQVVTSDRNVQPSSYWKVGEQIEIQSGPFAGLKGILLCIKNRWQLVISIDILMRSVAVTIEAAEAKIMHVPPPAPGPSSAGVNPPPVSAHHLSKVI